MSNNKANDNYRFSIITTPGLTSGVIAKQPILFKILLSITTFVLSSISGGLSGLAGVTIALNIIIPSPNVNLIIDRVPFLCATLVTLIWINVTLKRGLIQGLYITFCFFIVFIFMFLIYGLWVLKLDIFGDLLLIIFVATLVLISLSIISFFSGSYSICLFYYLFNFGIKSKIFLLFLIILSSAISTHLFVISGFVYNRSLENIPPLLEKQITWSTVWGGFLFSVNIGIFALLATNCCEPLNSHFRFLRDWALALASWGGTSFYNLDLSNVNFKNAKLANTDLRARKLYRTCFQGVKGLERARVDSRYLDLENPKVQKLLTQGFSEDKDFSQVNLRGAYLQNTQMRRFNFTDTELTGADLQGADLRGSILVRTQVIGVNFTGANLTGICIEDWSVNSQTCFTNVECDYVYRKLDETGELTDRFPANRNFEPREFESLYQQVENTIQLIFNEGENWQAILFNSLKKLQIEDEELGLQFQGIEKRGDYWVIKVTYDESFSKVRVEERINSAVQDIRHRLADKERELNWLQRQYENILGIASNQAEALKGFSKQPFGNNFVITGSTITNLVGTGNIDYNEASNKIRSIVANGSDPTQVATDIQHLLEQFQGQGIATTPEKQAELIQQLILTEAQNNRDFQQLFVQQGQQIIDALPEGAIATAIKNAIAQLR
jgi:uncharacterized protein YjbI with pentapeptide repeats